MKKQPFLYNLQVRNIPMQSLKFLPVMDLVLLKTNMAFTLLMYH
jgi:hypothetical protein